MAAAVAAELAEGAGRGHSHVSDASKWKVVGGLGVCVEGKCHCFMLSRLICSRREAASRGKRRRRGPPADGRVRSVWAGTKDDTTSSKPCRLNETKPLSDTDTPLYTQPLSPSLLSLRCPLPLSLSTPSRPLHHSKGKVRRDNAMQCLQGSCRRMDLIFFLCPKQFTTQRKCFGGYPCNRCVPSYGVCICLLGPSLCICVLVGCQLPALPMPLNAPVSQRTQLRAPEPGVRPACGGRC